MPVGVTPPDQGDIIVLMVDTAEGLRDVEAIASDLKVWAHPVDFGDTWAETPDAQ